MHIYKESSFALTSQGHVDNFHSRNVKCRFLVLGDGPMKRSTTKRKKYEGYDLANQLIVLIALLRS